jgi:hypothetical protein
MNASTNRPNGPSGMNTDRVHSMACSSAMGVSS